MKKYAALAAVAVMLGVGGCASASAAEPDHDVAVEICEAIEHGTSFDALIAEHGQPIVDHAALEVCSFS